MTLQALKEEEAKEPGSSQLCGICLFPQHISSAVRKLGIVGFLKVGPHTGFYKSLCVLDLEFVGFWDVGLGFTTEA